MAPWNHPANWWTIPLIVQKFSRAEIRGDSNTATVLSFSFSLPFLLSPSLSNWTEVVEAREAEEYWRKDGIRKDRFTLPICYGTNVCTRVLPMINSSPPPPQFLLKGLSKANLFHQTKWRLTEMQQIFSALHGTCVLHNSVKAICILYPCESETRSICWQIYCQLLFEFLLERKLRPEE